ncbi:MAG: aminotransferase class V-fold PLP-dependent enzyme, partial [Hyphomicrobium sp.]
MSIVDPFSGPTDLDTLASAAEGKRETQNLKSSGLPDPVLLTRLANELFSALPNQSFPMGLQPTNTGMGFSPQSLLGQQGSPSPPTQETFLSAATRLNNNTEPHALLSLANSQDVQHIALEPLKANLSSQGIDQSKIPSLPFNAPEGQKNVLIEDVLHLDTNDLKAGGQIVDETNFVTLDEIIGSSQDLVREVPVGLSGGIKSDSQLASLSHILESLKKEEAEFNNHRNKLDSDELKNDPHHFGISVPASLRISNANNVVPLFEAQDHRKFLSGLETFKQKDLKETNKFENLYFLPQTSSALSAESQEKMFDSRDFSTSHPPFNVVSVRKDFPILQETVNGRPLIWFDNAATTQKPSAVIERLKYFYEHENSNIHRAAHEMAARATDAYEEARSKVAKFIGANSKNEIIFTRGATEAINLV